MAAHVGTHHSVENKADQDLDRTLAQLGVLPDRQEEEQGGGEEEGGGGGAVVDGLDSQNQISKRGRPKRRNKYGIWQIDFKKLFLDIYFQKSDIIKGLYVVLHNIFNEDGITLQYITQYITVHSK